MMISDEERRKVAQRLRDDARIGALPHSDFFGAVAYDVGVEKERAAVLNRLADLIEPGESGQNLDRNQDTVQKELPAVLKVPECDRDGLLTVAETMDQDAFLYREAAKSFTECGNHDAAEICYEAAGEYNGYAKVIREALGVEDFRPYMKECERRNRERGRITDGKVVGDDF